MMEKTITMPLSEYQKHEKRENAFLKVDKLEKEIKYLEGKLLSRKEEIIQDQIQVIVKALKEEDKVFIHHLTQKEFGLIAFDDKRLEGKIAGKDEQLRKDYKELNEKYENLKKIIDTNKVPMWIRRIFS